MGRICFMTKVSQTKSEYFTFPLVPYSTEFVPAPDSVNVIQQAVNRGVFLR